MSHIRTQMKSRRDNIGNKVKDMPVDVVVVLWWHVSSARTNHVKQVKMQRNLLNLGKTKVKNETNCGINRNRKDKSLYRTRRATILKRHIRTPTKPFNVKMHYHQYFCYWLGAFQLSSHTHTQKMNVQDYGWKEKERKCPKALTVIVKYIRQHAFHSNWSSSYDFIISGQVIRT